ncbi:MAG: hypothetical protein ABFQ89_03730 [Chloroflexota bacterium]
MKLVKKLTLFCVLLMALLAVAQCRPQPTEFLTPKWSSSEEVAEVVVTLPTDQPVVTYITNTPTPTLTSTPTNTPTPVPTFTHTPTPTSTPTKTATPSPTAIPTFTPTLTPTVTASPTIAATATSSVPTPSATPTVAATAVPTAQPPTEMPALILSPGSPSSYLTSYSLVTYYGSPKGWGLGILGESDRASMTAKLRNDAAQIQSLATDRYVLPAYHMVTTVADAFPGEDGDYNHHVELEIIEEWINYANANNVSSIMDLQIAHADLQAEFERVRHFLYHPHVHLALDPEFVMEEGQIPGTHLGRMFAAQINSIQEQMNQIALELGVNRVLIIHQFTDSMLPDKSLLADYPHVEMVIDADGVGGKGAKIADYQQYANENGFEFGGFKIFYRYDALPVMTPDEIMWLSPQPSIVIYQ